jgi:hypothetical protein
MSALATTGSPASVKYWLYLPDELDYDKQGVDGRRGGAVTEKFRRKLFSFTATPVQSEIQGACANLPLEWEGVLGTDFFACRPAKRM